MDAIGITFDRFREQVIALNTHLPAQLEYGGHYTFSSPDDRRFGMWFEFIEQKYKPRVVDLARPIEDFTKLPLVSGDFMNAPGGHDGRIEIRHPGCSAPIILDCREPTNPIYEDNKKTCPTPWVDRAGALEAFARSRATGG